MSTRSVQKLTAPGQSKHNYASDNPRAIVTGGAGTGKTVVARELCIRKAREGKRVP